VDPPARRVASVITIVIIILDNFKRVSYRLSRWRDNTAPALKAEDVMNMATATESTAPRLHTAGSYKDEMTRMREHLEKLTKKIQIQAQTITGLTTVCENQRDEIDRLKARG